MNKQLILGVAAALLIGTALSAPPAHAQPSSFIVTLTEEGPNVVATGSGTINTTALVLSSHQSNFGGIEPKFGLIFTGPTSFPLNTVYAGLTGPTNFGSGSKTLASSGSGMFVGVAGLSGSIYVPRNYVSGRPLMSTLTWDNATFASLGVTPGTYVWRWGSGDNTGSFTLRARVPEPRHGRLDGSRPAMSASRQGMNAGHGCGGFERATPRGRFFDPQVEGTNEGRLNFFSWGRTPRLPTLARGQVHSPRRKPAPRIGGGELAARTALSGELEAALVAET